MKRKIWTAVISLILVLAFLVFYFNYDANDNDIQEGTLVKNHTSFCRQTERGGI